MLTSASLLISSLLHLPAALSLLRCMASLEAWQGFPRSKVANPCPLILRHDFKCEGFPDTSPSFNEAKGWIGKPLKLPKRTGFAGARLVCWIGSGASLVSAICSWAAGKFLTRIKWFDKAKIIHPKQMATELCNKKRRIRILETQSLHRRNSDSHRAVLSCSQS